MDGVGLGAEVGRDGIGVREWNRRELRGEAEAKGRRTESKTGVGVGGRRSDRWVS